MLRTTTTTATETHSETDKGGKGTNVPYDNHINDDRDNNKTHVFNTFEKGLKGRRKLFRVIFTVSCECVRDLNIFVQANRLNTFNEHDREMLFGL